MTRRAPILIAVAVLAVIGVVAIFVLRSRAPKPTIWDGESQFKCDGDDTPSLIDRKARVEGKPLIIASGHCHLTIKGSNLLGVVAVLAQDDAVVDVEGGVLAGSPNAVNASGSSRVNLHGTRLIGLLHKSDKAEITGP